MIDWDYPDIDTLPAADEMLLRSLIEMDCPERRESKFYIREVGADGSDKASIRRLGEAKMIDVKMFDGRSVVGTVYPKGYEYVTKRDEAAAAEERRIEERKEDMRHDWKISVFTALVGVLAALGGTFFGYWLGAAKPFL